MSKGQQLTAESLHANIQVGIFMAFGWTVDEIAAHMGLSASAISARKQNTRHRGMIDTISAYAAVGVARLTSERIRKAEEDFNERKRRLHTKGYRVIEKALDSTLGDEEKGIAPATVETLHLRAAEMGIERTEGKPLDRKAILTRNENVTRCEVDDSDLNAILGEAEKINLLRKSALLLPPANVKDAELVQSAR